MDIAEAASGPATDKAGNGKLGIDDAISAALDASETQSLASHIKESGEEKAEPKAEAKAKGKPKADAKPDAKPEDVEDNAGDESNDEDTSEAEASKQEEEGDEDQPLNPPKHWPEADKQAFAKMTREGQEIALKLAKNLEGGFTRKSQELSDKARFADTARGLIDDTTRQQLQIAGVDELGYFRHLHSLQLEATRDPVGYVKKAMQHLGVTPDKLGISQKAPEPQPTGEPAADEELAKLLADPKVAQLEAQLNQLKNVIEREALAKQQAQQAQHVNAVNALQTTVKAFREALDENGQLQYPHFDNVQRHMGALMDTDPDLAKLPDGPDKLKAAYDMAVWARPDLRQSFIEQEAQKKIHEAQKKRDAERAKKVTSVKPAAGVSSSRTKPNSLDEAISMAETKLGL